MKKKMLFLVILFSALMVGIISVSTSVISYENFPSQPEKKILADESVDWTIGVYGDSQKTPSIHENIVNRILDEPNLTAIIHTGDLTDVGADPSYWEDFNRIYENVTVPLFPTIGNHEKYTDDTHSEFDLSYTYWFEYANPPSNKSYYSHDTNGIHFIHLDIEYGWDNTNDVWNIPEDQEQFLFDDLNATEKTDFVVLIFHRPAFGHYRYDPTISVRNYLLPLVQQYDVDFTLSGHDHGFYVTERFGCYWYITGPAGDPIYRKYSKMPTLLENDTDVEDYTYFRIQGINNTVRIQTVLYNDTIAHTLVLDENGEFISEWSIYHGDLPYRYTEMITKPVTIITTTGTTTTTTAVTTTTITTKKSPGFLISISFFGLLMIVTIKMKYRRKR